MIIDENEKVVTTFRISKIVKKNLKILVAENEYSNISDLLSDMITLYKKNNEKEIHNQN